MIELRIYSYITPWSTVPIGHTAAELSYTIGDDTLYNWDPEDIAVNGSDFFEIRGRQANIEMFNHYQAAEFASNMLRATQYFSEYLDHKFTLYDTVANRPLIVGYCKVSDIDIDEIQHTIKLIIRDKLDVLIDLMKKAKITVEVSEDVLTDPDQMLANGVILAEGDASAYGVKYYYPTDPNGNMRSIKDIIKQCAFFYANDESMLFNELLPYSEVAYGINYTIPVYKNDFHIWKPNTANDTNPDDATLSLSTCMIKQRPTATNTYYDVYLLKVWYISPSNTNLYYVKSLKFTIDTTNKWQPNDINFTYNRTQIVGEQQLLAFLSKYKLWPYQLITVQNFSPVYELDIGGDGHLKFDPSNGMFTMDGTVNFDGGYIKNGTYDAANILKTIITGYRLSLYQNPYSDTLEFRRALISTDSSQSVQDDDPVIDENLCTYYTRSGNLFDTDSLFNSLDSLVSSANVIAALKEAYSTIIEAFAILLDIELPNTLLNQFELQKRVNLNGKAYFVTKIGSPEAHTFRMQIVGKI